MIRAALLAATFANPATAQSLLGTWDCELKDDLSSGTMTVSYGRTGAYAVDFTLNIVTRRFGTSNVAGSSRGRYRAEPAGDGMFRLEETPQATTLRDVTWLGLGVEDLQQPEIVEIVEDLWRPRAFIVFASETEFVRFRSPPLTGTCRRAD